jgi:hypothetical protein
MVPDPHELSQLTKEHDQNSRRDERARLSSLIAHGLLASLHVLSSPGSQAAFGSEVGTRILRMLNNRAELLSALFRALDDQDAEPPNAAVGPERVRETLDNYTALFSAVAQSFPLRKELDWTNGTLSRPTGDDVLKVALDWPSGAVIPCALPGAVGFVLGEALINAVRHGKPGTVPQVTIRGAHSGSALEVVVQNECKDGVVRTKASDHYGGSQLVDMLAERLRWRVERSQADGRYTLSLLLPLIEPQTAGAA